MAEELHQVNGTFEECAQGSAFQHTVLKQRQVYQLMHNLVALGIVAQNGAFNRKRI